MGPLPWIYRVVRSCSRASVQALQSCGLRYSKDLIPTPTIFDLIIPNNNKVANVFKRSCHKNGCLPNEISLRLSIGTWLETIGAAEFGWQKIRIASQNVRSSSPLLSFTLFPSFPSAFVSFSPPPPRTPFFPQLFLFLIRTEINSFSLCRIKALLRAGYWPTKSDPLTQYLQETNSDRVDI